MRLLLLRAIVVLALLQSAWLAFPWVRDRVLAVEATPAARGLRVAVGLGCFACHGPGGAGSTPNPGSEEGTVPAFTERTQMMYVKTADDLREYVLDGAPRRKRDDPDYRAKMEAAALHMPAYRGYVGGRDLEDLVVYLRATSGQVMPDEKAATRGADVATEHGCFACHGALGAGGEPNPGSFKGYIPGFWSEDFDELVRNDDELRAWIADGQIDRIAKHPIGGWFFRRQAIKMPAYRQFLPAEDIDALMTYIRWLRAGTWRTLSTPAERKS